MRRRQIRGELWIEKREKMKRKLRNGAVLTALVMAGFGLEGKADIFSDIEGKLEDVPGTISLNSRLRYEVFDQAGGADVDGISHRIRYGYTSPEEAGFRGMIEGETLYAIGHGRDIHPADNAGDGTELNQLWLEWADGQSNMLKVGRQIYTLDDHRFIGHVGWRQNIQTFDALTGQFSPMEGVFLRAFYIDQVNTVTAAHAELSVYGINGSYQVTETHALTGFYYSLQGRPDRAAVSNETLGLRFTGTAGGDSVKWRYAFSYARQWENSDFAGPDFGHDYWAADIAGTIEGMTFGAGMEILGGDTRHGFTTPLATLHKFNGFADVFLGATGSGGLVNGLEDFYFKAGYTIPVGEGLALQAIAHWFSPRTGIGDYGTEIDLVASYAFNTHLSAMAKFGDYDSDGGSGGVGGRDKKMLTVDLNLLF